MDLATLLLGCSLHLDDRLMQSTIFAFSRGNPLMVLNVAPAALSDTDEEGEPPRSLEAAQSAVDHWIAIGGDPVIGLLPVRLEWAAAFGKGRAELFEPCTNVAIASAKLSEYDHLCRFQGARPLAAARRRCTLERYGASLGLPALRVVVLADLLSPPMSQVDPWVSIEFVPREPDDGGIFAPIEPPAAALPLSLDVPKLIPQER